MMNFTELPSLSSDRLVLLTDQLRQAVAAYLARFKGSSRERKNLTRVLEATMNGPWEDRFPASG
jgi:hypothetical protein